MGTRAIGHEQQTSLRDKGAVYEETRRKIVELVSTLEDPASIEVSACPGWSVHDVVAHMSGACADVLAGNIAELASDEWTQAQVEARRGVPFVDLLAEWEELGPQIAAMVDDFPGRYPDNAIADVTSHEHDIRAAIGRSGRRDSRSVDISLDFLLTMIVHPGMSALSLGPLAVKTADARWILGGRDPGSGTFDLAAMRLGVMNGGTIDNSDELPVGTLSASPFELLRAVTGRRSAGELRRYDWSVDPEPMLGIFGLGPFTIRPNDLNE